MNQVLYYSKRKDVDYHGIIFEQEARDQENKQKIADAVAKGEGGVESLLTELVCCRNVPNHHSLA